MTQTTCATMLIWAVLTFCDHFNRRKKERKKNPLTSTRPVGFAAGKNACAVSWQKEIDMYYRVINSVSEQEALVS